MSVLTIESRNLLLGMAQALDNAEREGSAPEQPEGLRYIKMTDALAKEWARTLREVALD